MLYLAPSGAVQVAMLWIGVAACVMFPHNRTYVALALVIPPLIGTVLLLQLSLDAGWGLIASAWLASCITAPWSILLSLTASNVKGNTKRAIVNAMFFIGYCAGCIASPQLWTHAPRYFSGVVTSIVTWCTLFVVIAGYRFVCLRDNRGRDASDARGDEAGNAPVALDKDGRPETDLTDRQDREFRYSV